MPKYRVFYDIRYRNDVLDMFQNIHAESDLLAIDKANQLIEEENSRRKQENGGSATLTGVSRVEETYELVQSERVVPIFTR